MGYTKAERIVLPIAFLIMLLISLLLRLLLLDKSDKIKRIPFLVVTSVMVVGELVKQIRGMIIGYDLWWIPLHFCSTFFVWFSLAEFTSGEFARRMKSVAFLTTLCLFVAMYISPRAILGSACENIFSSFSSAHSFFFHQLAIFYLLLSLALNRVNIRRIDAYYWITCMSVYFTVAVIFAYALNTNYFSLLYFPLRWLDAFRIAYGQIPYNLMQACVLIFAPTSIVFLVEKIRRTLALSTKKVCIQTNEKER